MLESQTSQNTSLTSIESCCDKIEKPVRVNQPVRIKRYSTNEIGKKCIDKLVVFIEKIIAFLHKNILILEKFFKRI